ncbi:ankyrin repeat and SOCS box protein 2-like [Aplochiton taeniatus]
MAAAVSLAGSAGPTMGLDDYSLYSNLSDDQLIQLAIERSLNDAHQSSPTADTSKSLSAPNQPNPPLRSQPLIGDWVFCMLLSCLRKTFEGTVSHFITGNGKRMVAYRRDDGSLHVAPEPKEEEEPIFKAIQTGDVATVRAMVKLPGMNLMVPQKPGWLALHEAANYSQEECLKVLLSAQPGMINSRTGTGQSALMIAVMRNSASCVSLLLDKGADPDSANKDRETPLYKACEKENAGMVAMLLNHGATVNKHGIQGWTALHEAASRNHVEICEMLVKAGAKIGAANIYGITPLFTAAQIGRVEALRFLLKHGADVNTQASDGATALYEAAKNGHEEIVELLLLQNADTNKPGRTGLLPIHIAAQRGIDSAIVSMLIPATSKTRVRRSGISPIHLAIENNRDEVLELLIAAGFDVNAQLSDERSKMYEDRRKTALYFAVIENNIDATTMLLNAGADPNLDPFSPLLIAVRQGCIKTVTLLVEHGANVNAYIPTHPTSFPATIMFCMKYLPMLQYLLDNGADAQSCFSCMYGSNPHPAIKPYRSERETLRYTDNDAPQNVQFCEMISTPSICRWAGPIIDLLLDYVGGVKLCASLTDHLDSYPDWEVIKEKATPPRPLMQLCRLKILQQVGVHRLRRVHTLPLPDRLIKFLNHD